jgi:hypothetical protein
MAHNTETTIPTPIQVQNFLEESIIQRIGTLVERASENGADEKVLTALNQMSEKTYNSPNDVSEALGKLR